jgi:hypothetical protein
MKETYENLQVLLQKIRYEENRLDICGDPKVTAMLTGLQGGYTKFCCFQCEWHSHKGLPLRNKEKSCSFQKQQQVRRMWHILL